MDNFFAPCPRGLEPALADELTALGAQHVKTVPGGVGFAGDNAVCYRANLQSRLASRILKRLANGAYAREDDIFKLALKVAWPDYFDVACTIKVGTTATKTHLRSIDFISLKVKDAICDRFRDFCDARPNVDTHEPDIRIQVFLTETDCTLYLDTSGAPLWQRGLRQKSVEAPLKENLAAGILRLTGWTPDTPLLDPMCGSGTFLLEAAQMAFGIAPGKRREFAFRHFRDFDAAQWTRIKNTVQAQEKPVRGPILFGSDQSPVAVRATLANLDRAGLLASTRLEEADVLDIEAPAAGGMLVCNPPYGERLEDQEALAAFYPRLGEALKRRFAGWTCHILSADMRLPKLIGLKPSRRTPLYNGAIECRLFEFKMVAGSNRRSTGDAAPG